MATPSSERHARLSTEVVRNITDSIAKGDLSAGDRLPSQRELQRLYGASRAVVLEALHTLEAMGLVSIRRGAHGGAFITDAASRMFAEAMNVLVQVNQLTLAELVEFREQVEGEIAFQVASSSPPEVLAELNDAIEHMATLDPLAESHWESFMAWDLTCHDALAKGSNNRLVKAIMQALYSAMYAVSLAVPTAHHATVMGDWTEMALAISMRDGERARALMVNHIRYFATVAEDRALDATGAKPPSRPLAAGDQSVRSRSSRSRKSSTER